MPITGNTVTALKSWLGPGHGRAATAHRCPDCRQTIVVGLDSDTCASTARADPTPITPLGETQAVLTGRVTYRVVRTGSGGVTLTRRRAGSITRYPAARRTLLKPYDVWPEHVCYGPSLDTTDTYLDPDPKEAHDECPY